MARKIALLFLALAITGCGDKSGAEANLKCQKSLNIKTSTISDFEAALPYCKKAAEAGFSQSQLNLGYMYLHGKAVGQDTGAAIEWLNRASDNGSLEAKAVLISIPRRGVDVFYTCQVGEERFFSQHLVNGDCTNKRTLDAGWKNVFFSKNVIVNYNYGAIAGSGKEKKVWSEIFTSMIPGLDTVKSGYTKYLTVYNCESGYGENIQIKDYRDGELAASFENMSQKDVIDPDSFSGMIFREVCKPKPTVS